MLVLIILGIVVCFILAVGSALDAMRGHQIRATVILMLSLSAATLLVFLLTSDSTVRLGMLTGSLVGFAVVVSQKQSVYRMPRKNDS